MKPCEHDSRPLYELMIGPLREKARDLGYALGVHGSLKRDIDLIACPWAPEAAAPRELAEALRDVARSLNNGIAHPKGVEDDEWFRAGKPGNKPHGRLCWTFHLGGGPYLDLSVMPRAFAGRWTCPTCESLNVEGACWFCKAARPPAEVTANG